REQLTGCHRLELCWPPPTAAGCPRPHCQLLGHRPVQLELRVCHGVAVHHDKSTAVVFILLFAIYLRLEEKVESYRLGVSGALVERFRFMKLSQQGGVKKRWSLVLVILLIAVGLFLFTYKSHAVPHRQLPARAVRLVRVGDSLDHRPGGDAAAELGLANPVDMIYHVQAWMVLVLLPLSVAFEGTEIATTANLFRASQRHGRLWHAPSPCPCPASSRKSAPSSWRPGINDDVINPPVNWAGMALCLSGNRPALRPQRLRVLRRRQLFYNEGMENFCDKYVVEDETWVYLNNTGTKQNNRRRSSCSQQQRQAVPASAAGCSSKRYRPENPTSPLTGCAIFLRVRHRQALRVG
uniref:Heparan-sulfate 6-O-sulfotransferase n=1 Tax=Macrostomum lignano TaxID=282301 RepID=A0A1I8JS21_9PLAT